MTVYVDDFLIATELKRIKALADTIKKTWVCSEEEIINQETVVRFCG